MEIPHSSSTSVRRIGGLLRALAALVLGLMTVLGLPVPESIVQPARALSCAPADINDQLLTAQFAFIGRAQSEAPGPPDGARAFLFDVELWVKGNLSSPVLVHGFEWDSVEIGQRVAMVLDVDERGVLRDKLCVYVQPETLLAIAALGSEPVSEEPPAILVGGEFGDARVMALDGRGRFIALGAGDGAVLAMAACPGGRRSVEIVSQFMHGSAALIAVRDTRTLEILRESILPVTHEGFHWPTALSCRDENADEVLLGLPGMGILQFQEAVEPLHAGTSTAGIIGAELAVVVEVTGQIEETGAVFALHVLDLATGELAPFHEPTEMQPVSFALSPDESRLAFIERAGYGSQGRGMLAHVFDLDSRTSLGSHRLAVPDSCDSCWGDVAWLDDDTLLVRDRQWDDRGEEFLGGGRVFSLPDFELVAEWKGAQATIARASGPLLVTIDDSSGVHRLLAQPIGEGKPTELRVLPTNNASTLLVLGELDPDAAAAPLGLPESSARPSSPPLNDVLPAPRPAGPASSPQSPSPGLVALVGIAALALLLGGAGLVWRRRTSSR